MACDSLCRRKCGRCVDVTGLAAVRPYTAGMQTDPVGVVVLDDDAAFCKVVKRGLSGWRVVTYSDVHPFFELAEAGLLTSDERDQICNGLTEILGEIERGELRIVLPEYEGTPNNAIYAVYSCREFMPSKVHAFIEFLAELCAGESQWQRPASLSNGAAGGVATKALQRVAGKSARA